MATRRVARHIAASIAIATALVTTGAWAAQNSWTGAVDSDWGNKDNWSRGYVPSASATDWVMFQTSTLTGNKNLTVVVSGSCENKGGTQCLLIGSQAEPLTFRAANDNLAYGIQFGTGADTYFGHYTAGDTYIRLQSGSYSTGSKSLFVGAHGNAVNNGHLTIESAATMTVGTNCEINHGTEIINRGRLKAQSIIHNYGSATATFTFDGGTLEAGSAGTLVADNSKIAINATSNGGTIDTAGYAVSIERPIADASGETGAMTFKGGGSVTLVAQPTYSGTTAIEIGTRLAVPSAIAGDKLSFTIPAGLANGAYPVIAITGEGAFADDVLSAVTLPEDDNASFRLSGDKKTIVCLYGFEAEGDVYIGATDGDLSTAANWLSGAVPTSGAPTIFCGSAATLSVGDTFAPDTVIVPGNSAVVTIGTGDLHIGGSLTNANRLAIASGASLTVAGNLVAYDGQGTFLYSNEGAVTVAGKVVCATATKATTTKQYEVVTANTQPIRTGGFLSDKRTGRVFYKLNGSWVVGAAGFAFNNPENRWNSSFYVQSASATLYSSADWTRANSGQRSASNGTTPVGDLCVYEKTGSLIIDTSDYDTPTTKHTVTLNGRIIANGAVTIKGGGTVVVNTTGSNENLPEDLKHTCITNGTTLAVTDTATLKISAGRKITGNGTVSLAAGTTLALEADGKDFTPCIDPSLKLPTTGTATIRIDGARLGSGDHHVIATVASGTSANVTLDQGSEALDGRTGTLTVDGDKLKLQITPVGTMFMVF